MKAQHILAFCKTSFGYLSAQDIDLNKEGGEFEASKFIGNGFLHITARDFWERALRSLFIGRREELESDERFAQLLPYIVLWRKTPDGNKQVFAYQRTKKAGEQRLTGLISVGVGGHVDIADAVHMESVIDIFLTIARATARELNEEVEFSRYALGEDDSQAISFDQLRMTHVAHPFFCGLINDESNPVGRVHAGVVFSLEVPDQYDVSCREEELDTLGWLDPATLLGNGEDIIEPWTKLVLENIDKVIA